MEDYVVLVDKNDRQVGIEEKIKTHRMGLLHRAFSIFIFNRKGSLLLQRRNPQKYHCGNLWSNTCCSHPRPAESLQDAIHRRLIEEMGFDCPLHYAGRIIYSAQFKNGLVENELDHVYYGTYEGMIIANAREVSDHKWIGPDFLRKDLSANQRKYTPWLEPAFKIVTPLSHPAPKD